MTLKEKFHQWLRTEPHSSRDKVTLREYQLEVIANEYAIGFAEWKDNFICQYCNGDGYTIEVEAECCMQRNDYCCGIPNPIQVQKGCYCSGISTKELLEIYKKEKGL